MPGAGRLVSESSESKHVGHGKTWFFREVEILYATKSTVRGHSISSIPGILECVRNPYCTSTFSCIGLVQLLFERTRPLKPAVFLNSKNEAALRYNLILYFGTKIPA